MRRKILILVYPQAQPIDIAGPLQAFATADDEVGGGAYEVRVTAFDRGSVTLAGGLTISASALPQRSPDTLMVVGGPGVHAARANASLLRAVRRLATDARRVCSVCTGAFLLASSGLLDGREAATHWRACGQLAVEFPRVRVRADPIWVRDGRVWTSAGVTAGIDLALALIEADFGRPIALAVARRHVVFRIRPGGQGQFSPDLAAQGIRDQRLSKLAEKIAEGPQEDWRTEKLAAEAGVSLRSLSRLFRKELNASPSEFVERVRIDQARRALLETETQIGSVAIRCGFGSIRRMDRAFSRAISATPTEFRARFKPPGATA